MKFTILGCGSSVGVPWITGNWGNCKRKDKFNIRTRCSAYLKKGNLSILIDTSPDIKKQLLDNNIKDVAGLRQDPELQNVTFELYPVDKQGNVPQKPLQETNYDRKRFKIKIGAR